MKKIFKLNTSQTDVSYPSSDSEGDSGDGGVKIKSMKRRGSDYNSEDEMQRQSLIGQPKRDWAEEGEGELDVSDEEQFHDVELEFHADNENVVDKDQNLPSSGSETSDNLKRKMKKKKSKEKKRSYSIDGRNSYAKSSAKCCSVL